MAIKISSSERYQEKTIQLACVDWLSSNRGYREKFDDKEAVGSRFDSTGLLDGRLLIIEVKVHVSTSMVRHTIGRSGTLESKIAGALRVIYSSGDDAFSTAANSIGDCRSAPLIAIAARSYADAAVSELIAMLSQRSSEWRFDFALWRWTGETLDILASGVSPTPPTPEWVAGIGVPALIERTPRAKNLDLAQMHQKAIHAGVGDLFEAFIVEARKRRMRIAVGRGSGSCPNAWCRSGGS